MAGACSYYKKKMLGNDDVIAHGLIWDNSAPASGGNGLRSVHKMLYLKVGSSIDKSLHVYNSVPDISNL